MYWLNTLSSDVVDIEVSMSKAEAKGLMWWCSDGRSSVTETLKAGIYSKYSGMSWRGGRQEETKERRPSLQD
jgi:hypothetical protein